MCEIKEVFISNVFFHVFFLGKSLSSSKPPFCFHGRQLRCKISLTAVSILPNDVYLTPLLVLPIKYVKCAFLHEFYDVFFVCYNALFCVKF